jgi:hypothetical protein
MGNWKAAPDAVPGSNPTGEILGSADGIDGHVYVAIDDDGTVCVYTRPGYDESAPSNIVRLGLNGPAVLRGLLELAEHLREQAHSR